MRDVEAILISIECPNSIHAITSRLQLKKKCKYVRLPIVRRKRILSQILVNFTPDQSAYYSSGVVHQFDPHKTRTLVSTDAETSVLDESGCS